jgi:glutamate formiminotransferase/glutamate formiminotransferase/formiminotetrahydrofolate cyclodeaminase
VTTLLAVPNVSEGRDADAIFQIGHAFHTLGARLLDVHSDPDHNRSVFTLAGQSGRLARAICAGAGAAIARIDLRHHDGVHPRVGALDVAPLVYLHDQDRGAACAEALVLADLLAHEHGLPVFLYGALAHGRTRAQLRSGGPAALAKKLGDHETAPDFGPPRLHPTGGAALVAARPPLIAFNVELAPPARLDDATQIAAAIRERGRDGLEGVRAIGVWLERRGVAQVSTNVEDHRRTKLADVVAAIARHATPARAELVGLAPRAAFAGFPGHLAMRNRRTIEEALAACGQAPG